MKLTGFSLRPLRLCVNLQLTFETGLDLKRVFNAQALSREVAKTESFESLIVY